MSRSFRPTLLQEMSEALASLVEEALPRTCSIWTTSEDLLDGGSGSGWCYDQSHIVTNAHVVEGFHERVRIRLPGSVERTGRVVGVDALTDLAVVEVESLQVAPFSRRTSPPLRRGEMCMTLGSPLGEFTDSVSLGVVSGLSRQIDMGSHKFEEAIQVDATINPGNSGGPLIDMSGCLIGVNFCSRSDASQMNFAIPTEVVNDVVPELVEHGSVKRAGLGIAISARPVSIKGELRDAVEVQRTRSGSQLQRGDVLLAINGVKIERRYDLIRALGRSTVGCEVVLHVFRDNHVIEVCETAQER